MFTRFDGVSVSWRTSWKHGEDQVIHDGFRLALYTIQWLRISPGYGNYYYVWRWLASAWQNNAVHYLLCTEMDAGRQNRIHFKLTMDGFLYLMTCQFWTEAFCNTRVINKFCIDWYTAYILTNSYLAFTSFKYNRLVFQWWLRMLYYMMAKKEPGSQSRYRFYNIHKGTGWFIYHG